MIHAALLLFVCFMIHSALLPCVHFIIHVTLLFLVHFDQCHAAPLLIAFRYSYSSFSADCCLNLNVYFMFHAVLFSLSVYKTFCLWSTCRTAALSESVSSGITRQAFISHYVIISSQEI